MCSLETNKLGVSVDLGCVHFTDTHNSTKVVQDVFYSVDTVSSLTDCIHTEMKPVLVCSAHPILNTESGDNGLGFTLACVGDV